MFRFKKRFLHIFILAFFFFSFLRSTLDEITKRYFKNYGGLFGKKSKKRRKNSSYGKKNIFKKRPGRDSNPRSSVLPSPLPWQQRYQYTRPTPYHLATEPCTPLKGEIRIFQTSTQKCSGPAPRGYHYQINRFIK